MTTHVSSNVEWFTSSDFDKASQLSIATGKPILLDIHSDKNQGCLKVAEVLQNDEIAGLINQHVIPLRVRSEAPSAADTSLINNHIFVWSPTVQLVKSDGSRIHEFNHAPRQTRHSVGYDCTHHEIDGRLDDYRFKAQFLVGMSKWEMRRGNVSEAERFVDQVLADYAEDVLAQKEASNLKLALQSNGLPGATMLDADFAVTPLAQSVANFVKAALTVPNAEVMDDWKHSEGHGDWKWYTDCLRELSFQLYQKLITFANEVENEYLADGADESRMQIRRILGHHHRTYREMQSDFIGAPDSLLDILPFDHERSLRENLVHCTLTEWWAHGEQIRIALQQHRDGVAPHLVDATGSYHSYGEPTSTFETFGELFTKFDRIHESTLQEFSQITDSELDVRSKWWEPEPVTIRFRLDRLGWHLYDHTCSHRRILRASNHQPSLTAYFGQIVFKGLAAAEAALLCTGDRFQDKLQKLAEEFDLRTRELNA